MDAVVTFLAMGGHAAFVWPALILTAVVLVSMLVLSLQDLRRAERALDKMNRPARSRRGDRR